MERRHFVLYKDRLDYFSSKADLEAGVDPRGRIALADISQCEEAEDGFSLRLNGDRGVEVKVYEFNDLGAWLDALEPLLGEESSVPGGADQLPGSSSREAMQSGLTQGPKSAQEKNAEAPQVRGSPSNDHSQEAPKLEPGNTTYAQKTGDLPRTRTKNSPQTGTKDSPQTRNLPQGSSATANVHNFYKVLAELKLKLTAAVPQQFPGTGLDWEKFFGRIDKDHSGQLDFKEFSNLTRVHAKMPEAAISDASMEGLFSMMDESATGTVALSTMLRHLDIDIVEEKGAAKAASSRASPRPRRTVQHEAKEKMEKERQGHHMELIKKKLKAAAYTSGGQKLEKIFQNYDKEGTGVISYADFRNIIRKEARVPASDFTDDDLTFLFKEVDADDSGSVEVSEFFQWLDPDGDIQKVYEKVSLSRNAKEVGISDAMLEKIRNMLKAASYDSSGRNWTKLFGSYDKDHSGELDVSEIIDIMRRKAKVSKEDAPDSALLHVFQMIDADGSGLITNEEFREWVEPPDEMTPRTRDQGMKETETLRKAKEKVMGHLRVSDECGAVVKNKLRAAAYNNGKINLEKLFSFYDRDNSGAIDFNEFKSMVRRDGKITANQVTDMALAKFFKGLDLDESGELELGEFLDWLNDSGPPEELTPEANAAVQEKKKQSMQMRQFSKLQRKKAKDKTEADTEKAEAEALALIRKKLIGAAYDVGGVHWEKLFNRYDKDKSGEIDYDEFRQIIRKDGKVTAAEVPDELIQKMFVHIDVNGDNSISFEEFVEHLDPEHKFQEASKEPPKNEMWAAHRAPDPWDAENDIIKVIRQKLKAASYDNGKVHFEKLFRHYDKDNSGEIDFAEFLMLIRKDCKVTADMIPDNQLEHLFKHVSETCEHSGLLEMEDFIAWACPENEEIHRADQAEKKERTERAKARESLASPSPAVWAYDADDQTIKLLRQKIRAVAAIYSDANVLDFNHFFRFLRSPGWVGFKEFKSLVRKDAKVSQKLVTDQVLKSIFKDLNEGDTGMIERSTFEEWVTPCQEHPRGRPASRERSASRNTTPVESEEGCARRPRSGSPKPAKSPRAKDCRGWLSIMRKGKADKRFVVLFEERIEYYIDTEAALRGERRGNIELCGISHIDETETGFIIHIAEVAPEADEAAQDAKDSAPKRPARSLELATDTTAESNRWLDALASKVAKIPRDTPMEINRIECDTIALRFNGLNLDAVDQEAFTKALLSELEAALAMPASVISRFGIEFLKGSIIAEISGQKTLVQELKNTARTKPVKVMGSHSIIIKTKDEEAAAKAAALGKDSVTESGTDDQTDQKTAAPKTRFLGLKKGVVAEEGSLVCEGPVFVLKKGVKEDRHLILLSDRFDCYNEREDEAPRTRVLLKDVDDFVVTPGGFDILIGKESGKPRPYQFCLDMEKHPESLHMWMQGWSEVFELEEAPVPMSSAGESGGKRRRSSDDGTKKKRKEPASVAQQDTQALLPTEIVLQGTLDMLKKGKAEKRHFVLYGGRLDYFNDAGDVPQGQPRGRILIADIAGIDYADPSINLALADRTLQLRASSQAEFEKWQSSISRVMKQDGTPTILAGSPMPDDGSKHEGVLVVEQDGTEDEAYVVLKDDGIHIYQDIRTRREGGDPTVTILKENVSDLEVLSTGFLIQSPDGKCTMTPLAADLPAWLAALGSVFSDDAPQSPQRQDELPHSSQLKEVPRGANGGLVWQSMLEVQENGKGVWKYFALHEDYLASFHSAHDMVHGVPPEGKIPLKQVQDVKVGKMGFVLAFSNFNLAFRVSNELRALDAWVTALHRVLVFDGQVKQAGPTVEAAPSVHQGTLELMQDGQPKLQHFILYPDRLEYFGSTQDADQGRRLVGQANIGDVVSFKVSDHGFNIKLHDKEMELRVVGQEALDVWLSKFGGVLKAYKETHPAGGKANGKGKAKGKGQSKGTPPPEDLNKGIVYQGSLGIHHGGQLTKKYFVLYKDRLDYHDTKEDADSEARPRGRMCLSEVTSYEAYGNGFILKLLGRSVGLHVGEDAEAGKAWERSLKQALIESTGQSPANSSSQGPSKNRAAKGAGKYGYRSPSSTATTIADASTGELSNLQRAFGFTSTGNLSRGDSPYSTIRKDRESLSVKRLSCLPNHRVAIRSGVSPLRRLDDLNSNTSTSGEWVRSFSCEHKVRDEDGRRWRSTSVDVPKITAIDRDTSEKSFYHSCEIIADKVTGDRAKSGVITARRNAKNEAITETPNKTLEQTTPRLQRSLSESRRQKTPAWTITDKPHEADRTYLKPHHPDGVYHANKVNGGDMDRAKLLSRGRQMRGEGVVYPDKVQSVVPDPSFCAVGQAAGLSIAGRQTAMQQTLDFAKGWQLR